MIYVDKDGSFYDPIIHFEVIKWIPILSCILNFNPYQMDVKYDFVNRYLNEEVEDPQYVNILKKNKEVSKGKIVSLKHVATNQLLANIFTQALDVNKFEKLRRVLSIFICKGL